MWRIVWSNTFYVVWIVIYINLFYCSYTDDHSRVILDKEEGDPDSDYINANYIDVSENEFKKK